MFHKIVDELKQAENHLKFKVNEVKYSTEFLEMKEDFKIAGKHLNSGSKNVGKIFKKIFSSERFTQLLNEQA